MFGSRVNISVCVCVRVILNIRNKDNFCGLYGFIFVLDYYFFILVSFYFDGSRCGCECIFLFKMGVVGFLLFEYWWFLFCSK